MTYDTSPERRDLPLEADEISEMARTAAGSLAGSPAAVRHLLARMQATLSREQQLRQQLRQQLTQLQEKGSGGPEQLLRALREMDADQRERLLGAHLSAKEAELEEIRQDLEMEAVAARSLHARLRLRAGQIGEGAGPQVKAALEELLRTAGLPGRDRDPDLDAGRGA